MGDILVSVCCSTYNHKKYIKDALDGFIKQKTNFDFEILIHDDCSTDGTTDLLKTYQKLYPSKIKLILQETNQWKEKMLSSKAHGYEPLCYSLFPLAKGKYLALCEGDDYWTDENKLQAQVDFMEKHPEHSICVHDVLTVYENGFKELRHYKPIYSPEELVIAPAFCTSTKMLRNYYSEETKEWYRLASGDLLLTAYYAVFGSCGYVPNIKPSVYRIHSKGVWSSLSHDDKIKTINKMGMNIYNLFKKLGHEKFMNILQPIVNKNQSFGIVIPIFQREDGKSPQYLEQCLRSIYAQKYEYFNVYLIGDDYGEPEEIETIIKPYLDSGNLFWENLPVAVEREKYNNNREILWSCGGVNATNYALKKAKEDGLTYICFLDYDDVWRSNHLYVVNQAIEKTKADWLCTKTRIEEGKKEFYLPQSIAVNSPIVDFLPSPGNCIKASVCFNTQTLDFQMRDVYAETGSIVPSDADLWMRMSDHIKEKGLKSIYVNTYTCVYNNSGYIRKGGGAKEKQKVTYTEDNITGLVVCHNTKGLMQKAYESVRKFHPNMEIIIIDNSDRNDSCYRHVEALASKNTRVFHVSKNIGHGLGIVLGLKYVKTGLVLIFDSDIEMIKSPVSKMLELMESDTYGVGYIEKTAYDGGEWGCKPSHLKEGWIRYLHPYFCLIQLKEYKKYKPFIHHGAPAINTCLDIHNRGLGRKAIKEFPGLGHSAGKGWNWEGGPREYILHDSQGTRAHRKKRGLMEIEGIWDKVIHTKNRKEITIITCTGDRPLGMELLQKWVEEQTLPPMQWIVVDDGKTPLPESADYELVRRNPKLNDPKFTMLLNMELALQKVKGDFIFFMEDDEYYAPTYIETLFKELQHFELVGLGRSRYYLVSHKKWHRHSNMGHASLAQTAFRKSFLQRAIENLPGDAFYDLRLWALVNNNAGHLSLPSTTYRKESKGNHALVFEDVKTPLYVGMKGMPGRKGIGIGHTNMYGYQKDTDLKILKSWIPNREHFEIYTSLKFD